MESKLDRQTDLHSDFIVHTCGVMQLDFSDIWCNNTLHRLYRVNSAHNFHHDNLRCLDTKKINTNW